MFGKMLIANRGEIACRIIRTARQMGVATVAVYSAADADARHVRLADEARPIGPPPPRESYLRAEAILEAARRSGAEAIHPGYGFLSENADFAEACAAAGLVFIGPPAAAIRAMGDKSQAKRLMAGAGVPLVPGYHDTAQDDRTLAREAERIGFPVLLKPSAGGGGKGMRAVESSPRLAVELAGARREALSAFGDDRLLIEKYVVSGRHVEIQVFADSLGRCLHLFERDCSIQRRHQKVVEEAPAWGLEPALRRRMGESAVAAARAIGYVGAGTVEFLLDGADSFYFMEMNTRLQVEHPVTEAITGLDLVEWQLTVAAGQPLPLGQEDIAVHGHAIEVRLYAEDPERDFLPSAGRLEHLRLPPAGPHLRIDSGVAEGDRITPHYDPMIAKLIIWGHDRPAAVRRLQQALRATEVAGVATNADFLAAVAGHPAFVAADIDTGFIARHAADLLAPPPPASRRILALAALGLLLERQTAARTAAAASPDPCSPWGLCSGWQLNDDPCQTVTLADGSAVHAMTAVARTGGFDLAGLVLHGVLDADGRLAADVDGVRRTAGYWHHGHDIRLFVDGRSHRLLVVEPLPDDMDDVPGGGVISPMPGTLTAVMVKAGQKVTKGEALAVIEAMKMEHTLKAPADGTVATINFAVGDLVEEGAALVDFIPGEERDSTEE
jgi:3-methylcrotonyl-CoA carboxylase alpha subunit